MEELWANDPFPPTQWTRIARLGALGDKPARDLTPAERERWCEDFEQFVAIYRDPIIAVIRVRHPEPGRAEELAADFLGEVGAESHSLRGASAARSSFRRYLQGWLRNYGSVARRRELTTEHRLHRGGDAYEIEAADDGLEAREHRAWVRSIVRSVLARVHTTESRQKQPEQTCSFAIARYHGIPLPGDAPQTPCRLPLPELAKLVGTTLGGLKNRITRGIKLFRQHLEPLLRDTVDCSRSLRVESRWFFGVLDVEYPGLCDRSAAR